MPHLLLDNSGNVITDGTNCFSVTWAGSGPDVGVLADDDWAIGFPNGTTLDAYIFSVPVGTVGIYYRIDGGAWNSLGASVAGTYQITGLTAETGISVEIRINSGSASNPKYISTGVEADPLGFRGWRSTDFGTTADYFVTPYGDDANGGTTVGAAKLTIDSAMTAASSGDVVKVRGGFYPEEVSVKEGVTLEAYGDERPIIPGRDVVTPTQCSSSDSGFLGSALGVNGSPVYKYTVAKSSLPYDHPLCMFPAENGKGLAYAIDRATDTSETDWKSSSTFHVADSQSTSGGYITGYTDSSVINSSNYTNGQLTDCYALVFHSPNLVSIEKITSANVSTNTIGIGGSHAPNATNPLRYAILSPTALQAGRWIARENGTDLEVYYYPRNGTPGEFSIVARENAITLPASTSATTTTIKGIQGIGTATDGNGSALRPYCIGKPGSSASTNTVKVQDCHAGESVTFMTGQRDYTFLAYNASNHHYENCTVHNGGRLVDFLATSTASDNLAAKCHFHTSRDTPVSLWKNQHSVIAHNLFEYTSSGAHGNKYIDYLVGDDNAVWGNEWTDTCSGYGAIQQTSGHIFCFNVVHNYWPGTSGERGYVEQGTQGGISDGDDGFFFNNALYRGTGETYTGFGLFFQTSGSLTPWNVHNNILDAVTAPADLATTVTGWSDNIVTRLQGSQVSGDFPDDVVETDLSVVFNDHANRDFSPADSSSPIVTNVGTDMSTDVTTIEGTHSQYTDFDKDYKNQTIDWADNPMGPDSQLSWVRP